jgi:mRNA-degrading endonuclease RelE of RelBE toxin-antitoxin system
MTYQIEFKTRAKKELAHVPKEFAQKIIHIVPPLRRRNESGVAPAA